MKPFKPKLGEIETDALKLELKDLAKKRREIDKRIWAIQDLADAEMSRSFDHGSGKTYQEHSWVRRYHRRMESLFNAAWRADDSG